MSTRSRSVLPHSDVYFIQHIDVPDVRKENKKWEMYEIQNIPCVYKKSEKEMRRVETSCFLSFSQTVAYSNRNSEECSLVMISWRPVQVEVGGEQEISSTILERNKVNQIKHKHERSSTLMMERGEKKKKQTPGCARVPGCEFCDHRGSCLGRHSACERNLSFFLFLLLAQKREEEWIKKYFIQTKHCTGKRKNLIHSERMMIGAYQRNRR